MNNLQIIKCNWQTEQKALSKLRRSVFIEEQQVAEQDEWDQYDQHHTHFLVSLNDHHVACARLLKTGQIGRMAVLKQYRNIGIGAQLLTFVCAYARAHQYPEVFLHAQVHAVSFYQKHHFQVIGDIFEDAGIHHRTMQVTATSASTNI